MYRNIYIFEYYLNNMEKIIKNPLEIRKKISLNINTGILSLVEEIARLTKTNNTLVIESLLVKGVSPLFKQFRNSWGAIPCETQDREKKDRLDKLLKELKRISEKKEYRALIEA